MKKIMFVCHGNICRSPMAEIILRDLSAKQGIALHIASSATTEEEIYRGIGNPVYPPARAELEKHGLSAAGKRAVRLRAEDYGRYDCFIGMDGENIRDMTRLFGGDPEKKIRRLMDYTPRGGDVSDPWYSGRFDIAYRDIAEGCQGILDRLGSGQSL